MKAKDLTSEIKQFQTDLIAHRDLWGSSLDSTIPRYPIRNEKVIEEQSRQLGRTAGRLMPYLRRFRASWIIRFGAGPAFDAIDAATGMAQVALVKGEALQNVIDALDRIIGELESLDPDADVPDDPELPVGPGATGAERRLIPATRRVLLIHGHDDANLSRIADLMRERGLEPVILRKEPARGRTLIEKFEQVAATCAFAFALMTPDDQVRIDVRGPDVRDYFEDRAVQMIRESGQQYAQARPNVTFELGWVYGRLSRDRVCILFRKGTQIHSDLEGIERIEFTDSVDEVVPAIERELRAAGLLQT